MLRVSQIDRLKFEKSLASGYIDYFNTGKYYEFLVDNDLLAYDDDAINCFKNKGYTNTKKFRLVLSKSLKNKYSNIVNPNLLCKMTSLINPKEIDKHDKESIEDDKLNVIALIGFLCFEVVDSSLDLESFMAKFAILKYFAQQQLYNNQNRLEIIIDDYQYLKNYPKLFCNTTENKLMYKAKEDIVNIIDKIRQVTGVTTFSEACSIYEQQIFGNSYKKI
ncbi:MAG: hypothetical protein HFI86_03910 [Bacilli bacterium]|nr:hypothetical protein [Bacilli bacterium]